MATGSVWLVIVSSISLRYCLHSNLATSVAYHLQTQAPLVHCYLIAPNGPPPPRVGCRVNLHLITFLLTMSIKPLSPQELRVWHAFKLMGEDVMARIGRDIAAATGLSGPDFGILSRLAGCGNGELRQQTLAESMGWDKSRLSHQLTRMQQRELIERREAEKRVVIVVLTRHGREKLEAARPIHAGSVRRNLLSRLSPQQIETIVRVSNILGEDDE